MLGRRLPHGERQDMGARVIMAIDEKEPPRLDIAVTRVFPLPVLELLKSRHNIRINPDDRTLKPDELQRPPRKPTPCSSQPSIGWMACHCAASC